jgi:hypothetical protein
VPEDYGEEDEDVGENLETVIVSIVGNNRRQEPAMVKTAAGGNLRYQKPSGET